MIPGHVDIIIPVFNMEQYVERAIRSALAQTYRQFTIYCVNDGSTDYSRVIIQQMLDVWNGTERERLMTEKDGKWDFEGKLVVIDQENRGLSEARNRGIKAGKGEFILPLDSDDQLDPRYLELTIPKMADPQVGIVSTDMQYTGLLNKRIPPGSLTLQEEMVANNIPVTSLIRRSAFEQTQGYSSIFVEVGGGPRVGGYEDWSIWLDLMKRGWKVAVVNEPLFLYTIRPNSMVSLATKHHEGLVKLMHLLHPDLWPNP